MGQGNVLQSWMGELSWKQQSAILSSLGGPDNSYSPNLKEIDRWMRRITQNNADISSPYMKEGNLPTIEDIKREIEFCSVHYLNHLLQGLEIVGYYHPDNNISMTARGFYEDLASKILHLNPETKEQLGDRLKDLD